MKETLHHWLISSMITMINENVFRLLLLVVLSVFGVMWGRRFILSGLNRDSFYTSTEGLVGAILLRILLTIGFACLLIYLLDPQRMDWSHLGLPEWLRLIGFPVGLLSVFLLGWALKSLGRNFRATLSIRDDQILVTNGLYSVARHPMYSTLVVLWISYFLLSSNWFIGLTGILAYVVIFALRVPKEEKMMISKFGDEYIAYMKRTGRYLPRIRTRPNKP